jgi:hypothetical protein
VAPVGRLNYVSPEAAPLQETAMPPFYEVRYDFVLQQAAQALAAAE